MSIATCVEKSLLGLKIPQNGDMVRWMALVGFARIALINSKQNIIGRRYKNISTGQTAFLDKDIMNVGNETTLYSDQGTYIRGSNSYANKDSLIMCLLCVIGSAGAAMGLPASSAFYNFAY